MSPILLKSLKKNKSQVILNKKFYANHTAKSYYKNKEFCFRQACKAFDHCKKIYDVIVFEGVGSCAKVNLLDKDTINFTMAEYDDPDVIFLVDTDKGRVFEQILGTLSCLSQKYQNRVKGFIINKFRGDISFLKNRVKWLENKIAKKVLMFFFDIQTLL